MEDVDVVFVDVDAVFESLEWKMSKIDSVLSISRDESFFRNARVWWEISKLPHKKED